MNLPTDPNSSALKIFVAGRLDVFTAAAFRKEVAKISAGVSKVIFDLREVFEIFSVTGFQRFIPITQAQDAASKVEDVLNEFVDAEKSSPYVQVSFKKFLRDKATYSAEKIFVVSAGEEYIWKEIIAADLQKKCSARQSRCDLQRELD